MPQTYSFLRKNEFIEMKGYTKIADNTFPNFMGLLTGMNSSQIYKICNPQHIGKLDDCPMIWYDYRDKGYITAYAEDDTVTATLNYNKKGFLNPPTNYYFKPYFEATERLSVKYYNGMRYCTGPEAAGERVLNLAKDFAVTFKNQSTFGIFWMNTFSHNDINGPYTMDEKIRKFFFDLKSEGVLDNSFIFFLSDHGMRFGDIRLTNSGWLEERMPVNMVSPPKHFQKLFPTKYKHLKDNANKLISTYDVFMTLQHIFNLSGISYKIRESTGCQNCMSMFEEIPSNRSCDDAGISPERCTCMGRFHMIDKNHQLVKNATKITLRKIQEKTSLQKFCLINDNFIDILSSSVSDFLDYNRKIQYLFTVLRTKSSDTFLSTVRFYEKIDEDSLFFIRRIDNKDFCTLR